MNWSFNYVCLVNTCLVNTHELKISKIHAFLVNIQHKSHEEKQFWLHTTIQYDQLTKKTGPWYQ